VHTEAAEVVAALEKLQHLGLAVLAVLAVS
jgi:hypothetical protein